MVTLYLIKFIEYQDQEVKKRMLDQYKTQFKCKK